MDNESQHERSYVLMFVCVEANIAVELLNFRGKTPRIL